jgi:Restriction endonuclease
MTEKAVPEFPEMPTDALSPTPLSLVQLAHAKQRVWGLAYIQQNRTRRRASWIAAAILAAYVSFSAFRIFTYYPIAVRLEHSLFTGYSPLLLAMLPTLVRRDGGRSGSSWALFWVVLVSDVSASSGLFSTGQYLNAAVYVMAEILIGTLLPWGLRISDDPSVDWNLVALERITVARTARGGHTYPSIIDTPRKAEEIAAAWLRRFGYRDALVTPVGADDGVDAGSFGAVAQVKWTQRPITAPDVRDLAGTGAPGQARYFFSKSGYTKPALRWAKDFEHPVRLFILGDDGNLLACNYRARRSLWNAPSHIPVASRVPASRGLPPISIFFGIGSLLIASRYASATIRLFISNQTALAVSCAIGALLLVSIFIRYLAFPVTRIIWNIRRRKPASIAEAFNGPALPEVDKGLPSDAFVGFEQDLIRRIIDLGLDILVYARAFHRIFCSRRLKPPVTSAPWPFGTVLSLSKKAIRAAENRIGLRA